MFNHERFNGWFNDTQRYDFCRSLLEFLEPQVLTLGSCHFGIGEEMRRILDGSTPKNEQMR